MVRALRRTSTPPGLAQDGDPGMLQPPPDRPSPPAVPTGYVYSLRDMGDAGSAWSSPQQNGTGPATPAPGAAPVSRRCSGKAVCVQRSRRRARADAVRSRRTVTGYTPPGDVLCSLRRTPTPRLASEPEIVSSRLAPLRRRRDSVMTSPAAAAAGGLKAPNSAPTTACWARCCRARQATGSQAAVTEASSLPVRMTWQRWHSMRSATPRPPPSVSVLTPVARTAGRVISRTPCSHSTALCSGALLDR